MEFARKFRLVPADRDQEFADDHLSELDTEIQTILKKKIEDEEKAKLYIQALQKYVTFPDVNIHKPPTEQSHENKFDLENEILKSAPVKHRSSAAKILDFLKQHGIYSTKDQEVKLDDKVLAGSDAIELINFLLRDRTQMPDGFAEFMEILDKNHFPLNFVKNKHLRSKKTMCARPVPKNAKRKSPFNITLPNSLLSSADQKGKGCCQKKQKTLYAKPKVKEACRKSCKPLPLPWIKMYK